MNEVQRQMNSSVSERKCTQIITSCEGLEKMKRTRPDDSLDDAADAGYFLSYSRIQIHEDMLKDEHRTRTYRDAILGNATLFRDAVVVDVGCGTGILSMFAVLAGARHVYALERSDIADEAIKVIAANGMSDRITVLKGMAEKIDVVEKADVLISEWMGYCLLYEWMLETVIAVRDRWLKPNGAMFPERASISIALLSNDLFYEERIEFWTRRSALLCNLDMSPMVPFAKECNLSEPMIDFVQTENIISFAQEVVHFDLRSCTVQEIHHVQLGFTLQSLGDDIMSGLVAWFDVRFPGGLVLSTSPEASQEGYNTHWRQCQFFLNQGVRVTQGDVIRVSMSMGKSARNKRFVHYEIEMSINDQSPLPSQKYLLA
jgi:predicted RNA methylase